MKERGITMAGQLIPAILDGRKTQTRRVIRPQPDRCLSAIIYGGACGPEGAETITPLHGDKEIDSPYGETGDRLYVKESFRVQNEVTPSRSVVSVQYKSNNVVHQETLVPQSHRDKPTAHYKKTFHAGRFMPRWASRINLEVTDVRVERLQDISLPDVMAEGLRQYQPYGQDRDARRFGLNPEELPVGYFWSNWGGWGSDDYGDFCEAEEKCAVYGFERLWDSLYLKRGLGWDVNPWVRAYTFKVIT